MHLIEMDVVLKVVWYFQKKMVYYASGSEMQMPTK